MDIGLREVGLGFGTVATAFAGGAQVAEADIEDSPSARAERLKELLDRAKAELAEARELDDSSFEIDDKPKKLPPNPALLILKKALGDGDYAILESSISKDQLSQVAKINKDYSDGISTFAKWRDAYAKATETHLGKKFDDPATEHSTRKTLFRTNIAEARKILRQLQVQFKAIITLRGQILPTIKDAEKQAKAGGIIKTLEQRFKIARLEILAGVRVINNALNRRTVQYSNETQKATELKALKEPGFGFTKDQATTLINGLNFVVKTKALGGLVGFLNGAQADVKSAKASITSLEKLLEKDISTMDDKALTAYQQELEAAANASYSVLGTYVNNTSGLKERVRAGLLHKVNLTLAERASHQITSFDVFIHFIRTKKGWPAAADKKTDAALKAFEKFTDNLDEIESNLKSARSKLNDRRIKVFRELKARQADKPKNKKSDGEDFFFMGDSSDEALEMSALGKWSHNLLESLFGEGTKLSPYNQAA